MRIFLSHSTWFVALVIVSRQAASQSQPATTDTPLLEQLRDVHLPQAPSLWPPAPGWWVLFALLLLSLVAVYKVWKKRARNTNKGDWRREALHQLGSIERQLDAGTDANTVAAEASVLLRRVALAQLPRAQAANIQGERWLSVLDEFGNTDQYSNGVGRLLLDAPYKQTNHVAPAELNSLLALVRTTLSDRAARSV